MSEADRHNLELTDAELQMLSEALDTYGREVYSYEYDAGPLDALRARVDGLLGRKHLPPVKDA